MAGYDFGKFGLYKTTDSRERANEMWANVNKANSNHVAGASPKGEKDDTFANVVGAVSMAKEVGLLDDMPSLSSMFTSKDSGDASSGTPGDGEAAIPKADSTQVNQGNHLDQALSRYSLDGVQKEVGAGVGNAIQGGDTGTQAGMKAAGGSGMTQVEQGTDTGTGQDRVNQAAGGAVQGKGPSVGAPTGGQQQQDPIEGMAKNYGKKVVSEKAKDMAAEKTSAWLGEKGTEEVGQQAGEQVVAQGAEQAAAEGSTAMAAEAAGAQAAAEGAAAAGTGAATTAGTGAAASGVGAGVGAAAGAGTTAAATGASTAAATGATTAATTGAATGAGAALAGAETGATAGSTVGPVGTVVGAFVGVVVGGLISAFA